MQENEKYYLEIKDRIIDTETTIRVKDYSKNKVILENYYEIGRLIVEAQGGEKRAKYGNSLIKEYASKLYNEFGKKYDERLLRKIRQYYIVFKDEKWASLKAKLNWSHYKELLPLSDEFEIKYYIGITISQNLTYRELHVKIKNDEYKKLSLDAKQKLINDEKPNLIELVKNPIVINNTSNKEIVLEKELHNVIMEDISNFLNEFGNNYMFVGDEYKVKIGDRYHRIDFLLYNKEYRSYVVVELKIGELKKEHIGQIMIYMNYIDKNLKDSFDNKTIGIILCHKNNKLIMEYCSNPSIISREYILC